MKLEDIFEESEQDLKLDVTELSMASSETPLLFSKWNKIFTLERMAQRVIETELDAKILELNDYYGGYASDNVYKEKPLQRKILKGEIDKFLHKDQEYVRLRNKLELHKEKIEAVGRILQHLNDRKWIIKNIIEREKFLAGG